MPKNHKQVEALVPGLGQKLKLIDADMLPFLTEMWANGYRTAGSCQEWTTGKARVWFSQGKDRFLALYPEATDEGSQAVDFPMYLIYDFLRRD